MKKFELSELKEDAHIHFIGIGGISMSGIAQVMIQKGFKVSGSDRAKSHITDKLENMGATVYEGHSEDNIENADLVVHTAAVHDDNAELSGARKRGIRTIDRAECLGAIMKLYKKAVGVSGTHGKTSTTSMLAHALVYAKADPTISLGGELDLIGGNMLVGNSDIFVTEACEYTNSFLKFFPSIALITNIEEDHLDFFSGLEEIMESFRTFAELTGEDGTVIACGDDENVKKTVAGIKNKVIYYGTGKDNDIHSENIVYNFGLPEFDVYNKGEKCCHIKLKVPGVHNIKNALAATAVCISLGIDPQKAAEGIETYTGVHRRFERKGEFRGAVIMDDYAHHPTEIKATLSAARKFEGKRVVCVFQPHTYSRTRTLWKEFVEAFDEADELIMVDIFAAREPDDGVTRSSDLAEEIKKRGVNAKYMESFDAVVEYLKSTAGSNDIVFTMGAGNVFEIGEKLID